MSAHGISPTWRQKNKFSRGEPWIFDPIAVLAVFLNCNFKVNENDIGIDVTQILLVCDFNINDSDINLDITQILLDCDFKVNENDIGIPITTISLSCFTEIA